MNLQKLHEKKVLYVLAGTFVILLLLLITLLGRKQQLDQQVANQTPPGNSSVTTQPSASKLPKTTFSSYTLNAQLPTLPASVKLSDLKTSFTTGEALDLATKLGFKKSIVDDGVNLVLVTDQVDGQQALLSINKTNGNLLYSSESGFLSGGSDPTSAALSILSKLGLLDDTLVVTATYKRASFPGVTFVELHRSWEKLGLPILNPVGALNLAETSRLADVKLGYVDADAPADPDITESSDGLAGKVRPNDFNTVTVGVADQNNNVLTVTSNIKLLSRTQEKSSTQTLKTPEEAFEELKNGKSSFSLIKPTGDGAIDMNSVFAGGQTVVNNASVNEVVLTYLEEIGQKSQTTLYPYYLYRGVGTSNTGYQVQFVETVLAVKDINTLGVFAQSQNTPPTVFPGQGSTLQYGTFNWLSPGPGQPGALACAGLTQIFALPNGGYIAWYPNEKPRNWYYVPPPGEVVDAAKLRQVRSELRQLAMAACNASLNDPTVCAIDPSLNLQTACYYATTASPFLYFYSDTTKQMQVRLLNNAVVYADPPFSKENQWNFTVSPDQSLTFSNGLKRPKLYYEFDKKLVASSLDSLKKSNQGFVVDKNSLGEFVNSVSQKLGLNLSEKESLLVELTREAKKLSTKTLKVGLLHREMLDKVLPVSITPQPQTYHRIFFYVTSASSKERLESPALQKLTRVGDTVVELGAVSF